MTLSSNFMDIYFNPKTQRNEVHNSNTGKISTENFLISLQYIVPYF